LDVVSLWHVFEHLDVPGAAISRIAAWRATGRPSYLYSLLKRNARSDRPTSRLPRLGSRSRRRPRSSSCLRSARAPGDDRSSRSRRAVATIDGMEGSGFGGLFGDPDELQRRLGEFAEQMQGAQRLAWADNAIKLAVDLTVAAMNRANIQGTTEQQAEQLRSVMATIFPEAVTLVREAREGLQ
jgi:hypothetical protein